MAHFAEMDENNVVLRVIVVNDNDCKGPDGQESEQVGQEYCARVLGGRWLQTSYNNNIRGVYAGIGYTYDETNDVFVPPPNEEESDEA